MMIGQFRIAIVLAALAFCGAVACKKSPQDEDTGKSHRGEAEAATNRIAIPSTVRRNLGITFAKVEKRRVARTMRLPGRFERPPEGYRQYRTGLRGTVEVLVRQFQPVTKGAAIFRIDSPDWREHQEKIATAESELRLATAGQTTIEPLKKSHEIHEESLRATVELWTERVEQLEQLKNVGGGKSEELNQAKVALSAARAELADVTEKDADLAARAAQLVAQESIAKSRIDLHLSSASAMTGLTADALREVDASGRPLWHRLDRVEIRADAAGVVESVAMTNGAWGEEGDLVVRTTDPTQLRFFAQGLQSDFAAFKDGASVRIVPPEGAPDVFIPGTLRVGLEADPSSRTFQLFVDLAGSADWARAGVAAFLEISDAATAETLAMPMACIARDGLKPIIFRRDPLDPDKAIRLEGDLGKNDGRWIVVESGVKEGDEVVVDGAYQLMLASSAVDRKGGHFHPDGTFHDGEDK